MIGVGRLLFGMFMLMFSYAQAQQIDYRLDFSAGEMAASENLDAFVLQPHIPAEDLVLGYYFRVVQFHATPGSKERAEMEDLGLRFLDYIPNFAYIMAIPKGFDRSVLHRHNVRGVHELQLANKIKQNLQERPLPSWAQKAPGMIDLELSFFRGLNEEWVREQLIRQGVELIENTYFGTISARIPADRIEAIAAFPFLSFVEPVSPPAEPENGTARTLHRSNAIASDHPMGRHYDGTGVVVAMGDDGIIGPHIDYTGRADQSRVTANNGNHGDHVAGTIFGAGNLNPLNRGMAFGATLHVYQVWDAVNNGGTANQQDGVMLTSTSYSNGCNAGYTSFARTADQMIRENPTLLHIFSAGNNGTQNCGYGAGAGWGNVTGGVKIGKNVIAVANVSSNGAINNSSSRGPAHDGRIKPEVSAKGTNVSSTIDVNDYASFTGTSMAAPGVAGTTAQIIHAYRDLNSQQDPPSALTKAILMNTASDLGNPGPDFKYGFGHINAHRAVLALENNTYLGDSIDHNGSNQHTITVPAGTQELKVMVYWHDYEASVNASTALVNNLDMVVTDPNSTAYLPWVLNTTPNATALDQDATRGVDNLNNMEQVTLTAPAAGTYTIDIAGTNVPQGPQEYFVVYEMRDSAISVTYPIGGEGINPGETEKVRWDAAGNTGVWTIEYTTNNGSTWLLATSGLNASRRYFDLSIPSNFQTAEMRVRVTRASGGGESPRNASIMKVPTGLLVASACPNSLELRWDSIATASAYDIFMLGNKYMDSIGTTTNARYTVNGINSQNEYWFAVRARDANGARSRRTVAIQKNPGIFACTNPNDVGVQYVSGPGEGIFQHCTGTSTPPVLVVLENFSPNTITNIPVHYQLDGGTVVSGTFTGSLPGFDTASFAFPGTADLSAAGNHTFTSWTTFGTDPFSGNDTAWTNVEVRTGTLASMPFAEDFESFPTCNQNAPCASAICQTSNGWYEGNNNFTDDIDWRADINGTPSNGTGPSKDHNPGTTTGRYMYTEASNCFEQVAMLYTPCLDFTSMNSPEMEFWLNMNGGAMGQLHIDVFANNRWYLDAVPMVSWNWGDLWRRRNVPLPAFAGQIVNIRFRGVTGSGFESDMAIDDVTVYDGVVAVDPAAHANTLEVHPNPSAGIFNYSIGQLFTEKIRLTVVDLTGRIVISEEISNFTSNVTGQVNLKSQSSGVYFLRIEAEGQAFGKRINLQR